MAVPHHRARVRAGELASLYAARFSGNWALRFFYPFLPAIARGVGISLDTAGVIAGARELMGVAAPWLARFIDQGRQRGAMVLTLVAMGTANAVVGIDASVVLFTVAMLGFGIAKVAHDTASNAWVGDQVSFVRRGRVVGLLETSWAAAFLVGVPVTAWLIDVWSWRAPFLAVGLLAFGLAFPMALVVRPDDRRHPRTRPRRHLDRTALALYLMLLLQNLGPQLVFASYGAWLEEDFGFTVAGIGLTTMTIGVVELLASSGSAAFTDRLGKRRSILAGMSLLVPVLAMLGLAGANLPVSLVLLGSAFLGFEFAIVSSFPLAAEVSPEARASGIATSFAAITVGRAVGAAAGVFLFVRFGMGVTGTVGALIVVAGIVVLLRGVHEPTP